MDLRNKWDEWRTQWCHVCFPEANDSFAAPTAPPAVGDNWDCLDERDTDLAPAIRRIEELHSRGLTGRHVALHFLRCAIAPL